VDVSSSRSAIKKNAMKHFRRDSRNKIPESGV
jgi:hypothetical protein